ncbi:hypothetical protein LUW77_18015 [Streptomyces radiopugnans]|nr:hypothetical protein LUW77_18015 [Streptomyces radiopugnans]
MADRLYPSRSCRSRANRRRSSVTAIRAISAREAWTSATRSLSLAVP